MKIAFYSDLHLETLRSFVDLGGLPASSEAPDLVVLAGDVDQGVYGVEMLVDANLPIPCLYVAGNHEYYHHDIETLDARLRELTEHSTTVFYLQRRCVIIEGVRFLGCTLWTDFNFYPEWAMSAKLLAQAFLPDYRLIRYQGCQFTPSMSVDLHIRDVEWLRSELIQPFEGKTVVVTHHAPHPLSVHERYRLNPINAAFVSDLTELMPYVDVWLHGHMHDSFDYSVKHENGRSTRVLVNPRGYLRKRAKVRRMQKEGLVPGSHVFENRFFDSHLIFSV